MTTESFEVHMGAHELAAIAFASLGLYYVANSVLELSHWLMALDGYSSWAEASRWILFVVANAIVGAAFIYWRAAIAARLFAVREGSGQFDLREIQAVAFSVIGLAQFAVGLRLVVNALLFSTRVVGGYADLWTDLHSAFAHMLLGTVLFVGSRAMSSFWRRVGGGDRPAIEA